MIVLRMNVTLKDTVISEHAVSNSKRDRRDKSLVGGPATLDFALRCGFNSKIDTARVTYEALNTRDFIESEIRVERQWLETPGFVWTS
jgi:hypothetical protein